MSLNFPFCTMGARTPTSRGYKKISGDKAPKVLNMTVLTRRNLWISSQQVVGVHLLGAWLCAGQPRHSRNKVVVYSSGHA